MPDIDGEIVLYNYQNEVLDELDQFNGRALMALEMGLGKTAIALKWVERNPDSLPALVVCPAPVKFNWEREAMRFIGVRPYICEGQTPPKDFGFHQQPKIIIINKDILWHWVPYLKKLKIKTIICDEVQFFSHTTAQCTKALQILARHKPHFLALSGTPFTNRPADLWVILNILWPNEYPAFWPFSQAHCAPQLTRWGWVHKGATNLKQLHENLIRLGMLRRRKQDVLKDLPQRQIRTIPCEVCNMDEYQSAAKDFTKWLVKNGKSTKAEKVTKVGHLLRLAAKMKLRTPVEWANRFLQEKDEKLVMFALHKRAVDVLESRIVCKKVKVDGSVTGRRRQLAIEQFKTDKDTRLCIGSSAAGTGVDGLQVASEMGIVEFPYKPADMMQWIGRLDRIGQTAPVTANCFVAVGTLEEDLLKLLHEKQQAISLVLDGEGSNSDVDVFDDLLKVIEGRL